MAGEPNPSGDFTHWDEEQLRQHIQVQLERIAAENELRSRLLQEELDRRFAAQETRRADLMILLDERDSNTKTAYQLMQDEMDRRFTEAALAVRVALEGAEKAVGKAETANERRLDSVNEFRAQLADQTASFVTRNEYTLAHQNLTDGFVQLREDVTRLSGLVVPRNETDAWRRQLTDKFEDSSKVVTDRLAALELRLTSRLDVGTGRDSGESSARAEAQQERIVAAAVRQASGVSQVRLNMAVAIAAVSVLVSVIVLILDLAGKH